MYRFSLTLYFEIELFGPGPRNPTPEVAMKHKKCRNNHIIKMRNEIQQQQHKLKVNRDNRLKYWTALEWNASKFSLSPAVVTHPCFCDSILGEGRGRDDWADPAEEWGEKQADASQSKQTEQDIPGGSVTADRVPAPASVDVVPVDHVVSNKRVRLSRVGFSTSSVANTRYVEP